MSGFDDFQDKLWNTLYARGVQGLVAPADIRRNGFDRRRVRAAELREVARVKHELQGLLDGTLRIDRDGRVQDAPDEAGMEHIRMNPVVAQAMALEDVVQPLDAPRMLARAERELAFESVRRDLTIRHIAIMAEEEGGQLPADKLVRMEVDMDWMARWRDGARDAMSVSLKRYWARLLAGEVLRPGTYSVRTLEFFRNISRTDLEMMQICARFCFDGFIFRNPGKYFSPELHFPLFQNLEELGILRGVYGRPESWLVVSRTSDRFRVILPCQKKAIFVEGDSADDDVRVPVFRLTRFGREVFSLCRADADIAYLGAVAKEMKKFGYRVQLGDWVEESGQGLFSERMVI